MKASDFLSAMNGRNGQYVHAEWRSDIKPASAHKDVSIEKRTIAVVRTGINFANLTSVKEGIESGERGEVQPLPWGVWDEFPYVIDHKDNKYFRLYPAVNASQVPEVRYFVNGQEVSKADVLQYLTASKVRELTEKREAPECFTVKSTNLVSIR